MKKITQIILTLAPLFGALIPLKLSGQALSEYGEGSVQFQSEGVISYKVKISKSPVVTETQSHDAKTYFQDNPKVKRDPDLKREQLTLDYRILPPLQVDPAKKYPVVITLHGATGFDFPFTYSNPNAKSVGYNRDNLKEICDQFVDHWSMDVQINQFLNLIMGATINNETELNDIINAPSNIVLKNMVDYYFTKNPKQKPNQTLMGALDDFKADFKDIKPRSVEFNNIRANYPAYIICPQGIDLWDASDLLSIKAAIDALNTKNGNVDFDRIYVVGQSAGGYGTHLFIQQDPS